ncbi:hypothetical protein [Aliirhizobium cellulosilyticum]|uniref:Uncharacterized protein n=1 Tax=Aliirhizobium cellulosilyticum TaxID=393664 RepID=A0A7W6TK47_9HYPH|nr:hypothetical protein [Rhizobium cellulosilyticum]MBB4351590.1 hypothetical protein [Rhizobium cellulosilyticum]MBB4414842.1 hypothetical protein [Rhizobium cellulosilyticum]MBB4449516.1 hypothetical protein [Rhizobium cellulosilyticum]
MTDGKTFSLSANGDSWSLETDPSTGEAIVLHTANASSGGYKTRSTIERFLEVSVGKPEHDSLLQILGRTEDQDPQPNDSLQTPSYGKAMRYLELGGRRLAKVDDNIVNIREWEMDPMDAEAFWQANVEALSEREKREVFLHLPSISDADTDEGRQTLRSPTQETRDTSAGGVQRQRQSGGRDDRPAGEVAKPTDQPAGGPEAAEPSPE